MISSALLCLAISFHQPGVSKAEPISAPSTSDKPTQDTAIPPSDQPNKPVNRFSITLSSAFDLADRNNPELLATLKNMDMARAQLKTAAAIPNPQLAIQAGFGNPYTKVISGNTQQVGANQLIELGGKRSARMNLAKANLDLTAKQLEAQRFEIRCRVRKAYAELAAAEANIELVENQRGLIERLHKIAARRAMAGAAPASEEIQAQLALDQFDALRTSALARLRQASIQLDYLLGYKPERDLDVEDNGLFKLSAKKNELVPQPDYDFPPIEELLKQAYMQRLDLKASELQTAAGVQAFKLARKQAIPDLLLGSGYVFSTFAVSQHAPFQQGAYLNANVDIPIFYRHQGEIAQAKAQIEQARLQVSAKKAQIETDVHAAYTELMAARSNIKNFRETLIPRARDVVRMSQRSYEVGRSDLSNAIIAEQSFQQTLSGYFDAVVAYQNAWADLEKAIGAPVKH
ncbi:MAG: TolC family protein [Candidatus Obscuribacterales bacterium]